MGLERKKSIGIISELPFNGGRAKAFGDFYFGTGVLVPLFLGRGAITKRQTVNCEAKGATAPLESPDDYPARRMLARRAKEGNAWRRAALGLCPPLAWLGNPCASKSQDYPALVGGPLGRLDRSV
jgi:hypothetical protein